MQIGIDSFAAFVPRPGGGPVPSSTRRLAELLGEVEAAERAGIDVFGIGEHGARHAWSRQEAYLRHGRAS